MTNENKFKIRGVVYSIDTETINGVKDPTQSYPKLKLTLEVKDKGYKKRGESEHFVTTTNLIIFECFNPRFETDIFCKGDIVEIDFFIEGKEFVRKTGNRAGEKDLFNKHVITSIKHVDLDTKIDFRGGNKKKVSAMSDINKIGDPPEDNPFPDVVTNMVRPKTDDDDDDNDNDPLPF